MNPTAALLAGFAMIGVVLPSASAADEGAIQATVTVDAGKALRKMDPRRLGGVNVAMWNDAYTFASPEVRSWMADLHPGYVRLPGGSWSNCVYWNGNGVRAADGKVDPGRVGADGYPAVDYSGYAPSFTVDPKTLHPTSENWHGNVDVKGLHEFIKALGVEPMPCPNAGTGRAVDAAEWVKWANTKMGYNARYWEIGNELGGSWEAGSFLPNDGGPLTGAMYAKRYNDMASAMRAIDPSIRIGGGAFAEEMIRDCGKNVDFAMTHIYMGSTTQSEAEMFADIGKRVNQDVSQLRGWIHKYQPQREREIEIACTEWNLGGGVSASEMFSGLWASIFLGEMAQSGVDFATHWDSFTHARPMPDGHALIFVDGQKHTRKAQYYALWLWNNYMGQSLVSAKSGNAAIYTYASRSDDALSIMLVNTDREREAKIDVQLSGFTPSGAGEVATVTSREYYWNSLTHLPQWSIGPRIQELKTGDRFAVTLAPFSMTYVRVPDQAKPALSRMAQKALAAKQPEQGRPELRFVMPAEMYLGDQLRGELMALAAGSDQPYRGTLAPATLKVTPEAQLDRAELRMAESLGHFTIRPAAAGELTITAQSGSAQATHRLIVKPSVPRPVILWDFSNPPLTDKETFFCDFTLKEDLAQRANRAVARVDLPSGGVMPGEKSRQLLQIRRLPEGDKLNKENIRGVVFDAMTSADFRCEDPNARITVVMQSPADYWMALGSVPLHDLKQWKTQQVNVTQEKHIKAMPSAMNIWFLLDANKPAYGSVFFDRIGLMVR